MALTTRTDGSTSGNIIKAAWWNDFVSLLTGGMTDQAVTINNTIASNGDIVAGYGHTNGFFISSSTGAQQSVLCVDDGDTDTHLLPTPGNHKVHITKDSFTYDIALFDMSGTNGNTTLNGNLQLSSGAGQITLKKLLFSANNSSVTQIGYTTGTGNVTVNHNLAGSVIPYIVVITPTSSAGTGVPYLSAKTTTQITVAGTNGCNWAALCIAV